jgi:hypothetical protein
MNWLGFLSSWHIIFLSAYRACHWKAAEQLLPMPQWLAPYN